MPDTMVEQELGDYFVGRIHSDLSYPNISLAVKNWYLYQWVGICTVNHNLNHVFSFRPQDLVLYRIVLSEMKIK